MTAHAVGPSSAVPVPSKGAQNTVTPGSAAAFEHQLHAARQRDAQVAPEQSHQAHARRDIGSARDGRNDASPENAHARRADAGTGADKGHDKTSGKNDTPSTTTAQPPATAKAPAPPAANTAAPPVAEAMAGVAADGAASAEQDADGDEQGAAALVGAMLALVGPAAHKLLASGVPASSGKPVAAAAGAAVLLQTGDVAAQAVTTSVASTAMPVQLLVANGLSLDTKSLRDSARVDAAPVPGLPAPTATTHAAPVSVPISAPAGSHAFAQELGQQISWLVGQDIKQARIRLHPEELGSLDLKISVNHGRVDVAFHTQHPGAVTAVQQSLPQLDQMLAQHGLSLGHAEVGQHDRGEQSGQGGHGERASEIDEVHGPGLVTPLAQLGLVDAFA